MVRIAAALLCLPLLAACETTMVETGADGVTRRGPSPSERSCIGALANRLEVKRTEVSVVRSVSVPEGDLVTMQAVGSPAPWRCFAGLDQVAQTLLYLGEPEV